MKFRPFFFNVLMNYFLFYTALALVFLKYVLYCLNFLAVSKSSDWLTGLGPTTEEKSREDTQQKNFGQDLTIII